MVRHLSVLAVCCLFAIACGNGGTANTANTADAADTANTADTARAGETASTPQPTQPIVVEDAVPDAEPVVAAQATVDVRPGYATPEFFAIGSAVGFNASENVLLVTDLHSAGERGCEASPNFEFVRVPLDGSPRQLAADHSISSAGIAEFNVFGERAVWMEWCDGYPIGPFVADIAPDGALSNIVHLPRPLNELASAGTITDLSIEDGTAVLRIAKLDETVEVRVDLEDEAVIDQTPVPAEPGDPAGPPVVNHPQPHPEGFVFVTASGQQVVLEGLPAETVFVGPVLVDSDESFLYMSVIAAHPGWTNVLRAPLTAEAASVPAVSTQFTGDQIVSPGYPQRAVPEYLGLVADGQAWLVQSDPNDGTCTGPLEIVPRDGSPIRPATANPAKLISVSVMQGDMMVTMSGCPGGAQTITASTVTSSGELETVLVSSASLATTWWFHSFELDDTELRLLRTARPGMAGSDDWLSVDRNTLRLTAHGNTGVSVREPGLEFRLRLPDGWSAGTPGGGAGGVMMTHPSGAWVMTVRSSEPTISFGGIDPTSFDGTTTEPAAVYAYRIGPNFGQPEDSPATKWNVQRALDGEPGWGRIVSVESGDEWLVLSASIPASADPSVVAAAQDIVDSLQVGVSIPDE